MKHAKIVAVRMPERLLEEIERERKRMARVAGEQVQTSEAIRIILERDLARGKVLRGRQKSARNEKASAQP